MHLKRNFATLNQPFALPSIPHYCPVKASGFSGGHFRTFGSRRDSGLRTLPELIRAYMGQPDTTGSISQRALEQLYLRLSMVSSRERGIRILFARALPMANGS